MHKSAFLCLSSEMGVAHKLVLQLYACLMPVLFIRSIPLMGEGNNGSEKQVWQFAMECGTSFFVTYASNDRSCVLNGGARNQRNCMQVSLPFHSFACIDTCFRCRVLFLGFSIHTLVVYYYLYGKTKTRLLVCMCIRTLVVSTFVGWNLTRPCSLEYTNPLRWLDCHGDGIEQDSGSHDTL